MFQQAKEGLGHLQEVETLQTSVPLQTLPWVVELTKGIHYLEGISYVKLRME